MSRLAKARANPHYWQVHRSSSSSVKLKSLNAQRSLQRQSTSRVRDSAILQKLHSLEASWTEINKTLSIRPSVDAFIKSRNATPDCSLETATCTSRESKISKPCLSISTTECQSFNRVNTERGPVRLKTRPIARKIVAKPTRRLQSKSPFSARRPRQL